MCPNKTKSTLNMINRGRLAQLSVFEVVGFIGLAGDGKIVCNDDGRLFRDSNPAGWKLTILGRLIIIFTYDKETRIPNKTDLRSGVQRLGS